MKTPAQTPTVFCDVTKTTALIFFFFIATSVYAQNFASNVSENKADPADAHRQAVYYRNQGLELQNKGDLDGAMSAYKKAQEADPAYAIVYNDMGVISEGRGLYKQAEQNYRKAIETDPKFASAYSNLALLKEEQGELDQASSYWQKRAEVGEPDDPWTIKAKEKIFNLGTPKYSLSKENTALPEFQQQARFYREQGLKMQRMGNVKEGLTLYMKAQQLDPDYAEIYNDMGVAYEALGDVKKAEENYFKALDIDPHMAGAYSNLALLYEGQRDLKNAASYWLKRSEMGNPDDPWVQTAQRRLRDIRLVMGEDASSASEKDVMGLVGDVTSRKILLRKDNKKVALSYYCRARQLQKSGDEVSALKKAIDAYQLDPQNDEIRRFIEQVQIRVLSK